MIKHPYKDYSGICEYSDPGQRDEPPDDCHLPAHYLLLDAQSFPKQDPVKACTDHVLRMAHDDFMTVFTLVDIAGYQAEVDDAADQAADMAEDAATQDVEPF